MPTLDPAWIFTALGTLFLLLALRQGWPEGPLPPGSRAFLRVGIVFSVVALWLWWR
jgi:hypothetical protein